MSLKSSLADCWPAGAARSPKKASNAAATRSVAAGSLWVSGKRSNSSNSGSSGHPDAWHSAVTIRRIASRIVRRVESLNVRTLSCSVADSGMTLLLVPAWRLPTVSTAVSPGATSRETTVCSRTTIIAARTTGSIAACGMEPCAPRPCTVMRMLSAADSAAPARVPTCPARSGITCLASATCGVGTRSASPASTMPRAPSPTSSAGWKSTIQGAGPVLPTVGEQLRGAGQAGHVDVVAAGVHHRHLVAVGVGAGDLAGVGQSGGLPDRERIHVRPQQHRPAVPVVQDADHTGAAHPLVHLETGTPEPAGHQARGPRLLVGQLGVLVDV